MDDYLTIHELLSELDKSPGSDLPPLIRIARLAQEHRVRNGNSPTEDRIPRTSIFFACLHTTPELRELLQKSGLDYSTFQSLAGVEGFDDQDPRDFDSFSVNENVRRGLETFIRNFPDRHVIGAWELAYSIAALGDEPLAKYVSGAGGDFSLAAELIHQAIAARPGDETPRMTIDLSDFRLEVHVKEAMSIALSLSRRGPVSAAHLLNAAAILSESSHSQAFDQIDNALMFDAVKFERVEADPHAFPVNDYVRRSVELAQSKIGDNSSMWGRDLITVALLAVDDPSLQTIERTNNRSWEDIRQDWYRFVTKDEHHHPRSLWAEWFRDAGVLPTDHVEPAAEEESEAQPKDDYRRPEAYVETDAIPPQGVGGDARQNVEDRLNVESQAKIFASLLVAEEVKPPFALGLFGDWGVGKSFFMRLMQKHISTVAGRHASDGSQARSLTRVAQIEFNAWHYVDTDLWASLASRIFDELSRELASREDEIETTRRNLRRAIDSSQREQQEAEAAIEAAKASRLEASIKLNQLQEQRKNSSARYESMRLGRIWNAVSNTEPFQALKADIEKSAQQFGIETSLESVEDAKQVYDSFHRLTYRTVGLVAAFHQEFKGKRILLSSAVILGLTVLLFAWPSLLSASMNQLNETVTSVLASILQLATLVGPAIVWSQRRLHQLHSAVDGLEQVKSAFDSPRATVEEPSEDELNLAREVEMLDSDISAEQRQVEQADRRITEAKAEIQRIDSGGLVYDFLEGRVRDSRYLDRLGLISVIRKDFEQLRDLLQDWSRSGTNSSAEEESASATPSHGSPIGRIVLYIDDLDRCPPPRVVEVLQAVHLLLAFDLFAVVVAVDARWLERSLNDVYNPSTPGNGHSAGRSTAHRFSAHNYLEKIFQIPYSLPQMKEGGFQDLISAMVHRPLSRPRVGAATGQVNPPTGAAQGETLDIDKSNPGQPPGQPTKRSPDSKVVDPDAEQKAAARRAEAEAALRQQEQAEAEQRVQAMLLTPEEEQFIGCLFPFINTPRLAKRFVNVYRLIRVRASEIHEDFGRFVRPDAGEYRAVLLLLAVCVGRPETAPRLLQSLESATQSDLDTWFADNHQFAGEKRTVDRVKVSLAEAQAAAMAQGLQPYKDWAREVGRYSFNWRVDT